MKVHLLRSPDLSKQDYESVFEFLFSHEGPIQFTKSRKTIFFKEEIVSWDNLFDQCCEFRSKNNFPENEFIVLLTSKPNNENWFSGFNPKGSKEIFIHTGDWEYYVPCNPIYAVIYQVIENILQSLMFDNIDEGIPFFHDPAIGCVNDMCSWKADISFKLRTADICPDCLSRLKERQIENDCIKQSIQIIESVRKQALYRKEISFNPETKDLLPFPIAITKRKMSMTMEPLRKFLFLLDHFDSIIRTTLILFGKVIMDDKFDDFFQKQNLNDRPSLGAWVTGLHAVLSQNNNQSFHQNLGEEFFKRIKAILKKAEEARIVSLRNERRGHGYCDCNDSGYRDTFLEVIPAIEYIDKMLLPVLKRLKCYYVKSSEIISKEQFVVKLRPIMGDHPDFPEEVIEFQPKNLDDILNSGHVYVQFSDTQKWYDLHPFMIYDDCPICSHHRVLLMDGKQYLDPYVGHRVKIQTEH